MTHLGPAIFVKHSQKVDKLIKASDDAFRSVLVDIFMYLRTDY